MNKLSCLNNCRYLAYLVLPFSLLCVSEIQGKEDIAARGFHGGEHHRQGGATHHGGGHGQSHKGIDHGINDYRKGPDSGRFNNKGNVYEVNQQPEVVPVPYSYDEESDDDDDDDKDSDD